ncbi:NACHT, LRR and PYD domains-containing protein 3-like [Scleropages formosus]|nr:NACHT, LRR and PYD domains-containing protein 3-like [Scleropages formosus]
MEGLVSEIRPSGDCKEWVTASEMSFKSVPEERSVSPVPSCISMKSDKSMPEPIYFKDGQSSAGVSVQQVRSGSPVPSCISMKSDKSMPEPISFKNGQSSVGQSVQQVRSGSPVPSCISMKSDKSMPEPIYFKDQQYSAGQSVQQERSVSPVPTCISMKSDKSMPEPIYFKYGQSSAGQSVQQERPVSPVPSCVSIKSDKSMPEPISFKDGQSSVGQSVQQVRSGSPVPSCISMKSDKSMPEPIYFKDQQYSAGQSVQQERSVSPVPTCISMKSDKSMPEPIYFKDQQYSAGQSVQQERSVSPVPTCISMKSDKSMPEPIYFGGQSYAVQSVQEKSIISPIPSCSFMKSIRSPCHEVELLMACQQKLKSHLKKKFQCVFEGQAKYGNPALLNDIYTELYITEGGTGGISDEHEVRHIERAFNKPAIQETAIKYSDIFTTLHGKVTQIKTVLTQGIAGIGKTVTVQKFILDWEEGKENQGVNFIFPLAFRDLNLIKDKEFSLTQLIHYFLPEFKEFGITHLLNSKVLFIFDGLDECRLPLDFKNNEICSDVTKTAPLDMLLTNLMKGNLFPPALIWITSRPAAATQIPPECVDRVTEIRGFNDPQKDEYFTKRFSDEDLAKRIITHVKSSRSLYIMCHIPVFCWISATVLERLFVEEHSGEIPKTLTEMYTHFLIFQTSLKNEKYLKKQETEPLKSLELDKEFVLKLGKLAFNNLETGNLIFYEEDLKEIGIDVNEASVYSGICTEVFRQEIGLYEGKVYCFVHLSVQEYLAALHKFLSNTDTGLLEKTVNEAICSKNGHLDLYLRFLLGLSVEYSQQLLKGLPLQRISCDIAEIKQYIYKKIHENFSPEKSIYLFHCLNELNDSSVVKRIQNYLNSQNLTEKEISPSEWSALAFVLLMSAEELEVLELRNCMLRDEGLQRMLPVVQVSRTALLSFCFLTERCCEALASTLSSDSNLRVLDLSNNDLQDSGVKLLSAGLGNQQCKLDTLRLSTCRLTEGGCASLASALCSNPSHLRELDLSDNDLQDSGVELLSPGLGNKYCKLDILRLSGCCVMEGGCTSLASALRSNPCSHLRELDLSYNNPGDSGVKLLSDLLQDPTCKLEILHVDHGGECRIRPGLLKYSCRHTLDPNTANKHLYISEDNREVTYMEDEQSYPDHPDRFGKSLQVLCAESLSGRCYWEVEWNGDIVDVGVTYKGISRKGRSGDCELGLNDKSWNMTCSDEKCYAIHNIKRSPIPVPTSHRVGVYVDWVDGALFFYSVSSGELTLLYKFTSTFTEPLYPAFGVWWDSSLSLCELG